jgi:hypothetical protein
MTNREVDFDSYGYVVNYWFEKSLSRMKLFECYKCALRLEFSKGLIYKFVLTCERGYVV